MDEFKVILIMNETTIEVLKEKKQDYTLNLKIQKYLEDEAIFFKISKENAKNILKAVGVKKEEIENVYQKLTGPQMYYELEKKGKIKPNDKNLIVKYNNYNHEDLFKKNK